MMQLVVLLALYCPILCGSYHYGTWWRGTITHSRREETALSMLKSREKADRLAEIITPLTPSVSSKASKQSALRYVERRVPKEERIPLTSVEVGQRYDGLIINIKEFGMFIDIGTTLDGFVHVSDCSQAVFVDSLEKKYSAGQEISAWVKFVNVKDKKLGLQLFPTVHVPALEKLEWEDLERGKMIKAVVTKTSQYGSYLNINGPSLAFMHRRKMLSNNRQRKLQSWDLAPIGSIHDCYIYQVDLERKRIELTSFPPDVWERRFGTSLDDDMQSDEDDLDGDDYDDDDEDDDELGLEDDDDEDENEELGGAATASNKRAVLQSLDDDWEANAELDEDETEEILSSAEVQKLTGRKLLIDEISAPATGSSADSEDALTDEELEEEADELSAEELFYELSSGRSFITLANLKNWDYMRVLLKNGDLDNEILREMFQASGGFNGRLKKADFNNFLELFEIAIGDDDDDDEDSDGEDIEVGSDEDMDLDLGEFSADDDEEDVDEEEENEFDSPSYLLDDGASDFATNTADDSEEEELDMDNDNEDILYEDLTEKSAAGSLTRGGKVTMANHAGKELLDLDSIAAELDSMIEEDAKAKQITGGTGKSPNNLVDNIYKTLTRKKKSLIEDDVIQWDFCRAIVSQGIATDNELLEELRRIKGKAKTISLEIFGIFVEEVSQWEFLKGNRKQASSAAEEEAAKSRKSTALAATKAEDAESESKSSNSDKDDDEFDPEEDRKLLNDVFQSLAKGKRIIKHRDLLEWDFVLDLLTYGVLSEEDLEQKVELYSTGTARSRGMDLEGFDKFVNEMMLIHKDAGIWFEEEGSEDDNDDDDEDDEDEEEEEEEDNKQTLTSSTRSPSSSIRNVKPNAVIIDDEEEVEETDDVSGEDEDDDSIELDPAEIFAELSTDKKFVTYDSLRNWDFVKSMIERKDFSKFQFENLLTNFDPKAKNKLNLDEFEIMLDEIMLLAGILPEEEDDDDFDGEYEDGDEEEE